MQINLTNKTRNELIQLAEKVEVLKNKRKYRFLDFIYPDTGKYSIHVYKKAKEFFDAGKNYRLRMVSGGTGIGKSFTLYSEGVFHWTGEYPKWWDGKIQKNPKQWWILVESAKTWRDSGQKLLFGNSTNDEDFGTGLIPKDTIVNTMGWSGESGTIQSFEIRNKISGGIVSIAVKTTDQKVENLQAATLDGLIEDEEAPIAVHRECLLRLRGSPIKEPGIFMMGFTPWKGATDVVLSFCPDARVINGPHPTDKEKYVVKVSYKEVPHLDENWKEFVLQNCHPNEINARLDGDISLGSGKIYPYSEEQVFVQPFEIPDYWPRCFTIDFGYHTTCVLWGAKDPHTKVLYIYAEYYCEEHRTAQVHALNIKARGDWIRGICDPSGGGRQDDGRQLADLFRQCGLDLTPGDNSMVGITRNCNMFENGSLKIFNTCTKTKEEYRLYRFDDKNPNQPARNQRDHAMDCIKYKTSVFDYVASTEYDEEHSNDEYSTSHRSGYDEDTGY